MIPRFMPVYKLPLGMADIQQTQAQEPFCLLSWVMKLSRFQYKIISKRFYVIFNTFVNIVFFEQVSKTFRLFF